MVMFRVVCSFCLRFVKVCSMSLCSCVYHVPLFVCLCIISLYVLVHHVCLCTCLSCTHVSACLLCLRSVYVPVYHVCLCKPLCIMSLSVPKYHISVSLFPMSPCFCVNVLCLLVCACVCIRDKNNIFCFIAHK